ncbi:hypothetical protein HYALB_00003282 [Hymenoscyphus albidus]|uniref:Uncharacterized protein n=1 Tax=Hymenoscyphus albidus TaxID=595503 RepID=A0A9N9LI35_9HELO|nr:hypothetical protein HYALB_00003282 [Hymenoscyphus albidus]
MARHTRSSIRLKESNDDVAPRQKSPANKHRRARYKGRVKYDLPKKKKHCSALDAFKVKKGGADGKIRMIPVAKEDGIHSEQWALSIVPQPESLLLSLPLELRRKIYISILNCPHHDWAVEPKKKRNCYVNTRSRCPPGQKCEVIKDLNTLSLLSKQIYLEVVGSSLFYQVTPFTFRSPYMMDSFLNNISPIHRTALRKLRVDIRLRSSFGQHPAIPTALFRSLSSLAGLTHLKIAIRIDADLCDPTMKLGLRTKYAVKEEVQEKWRAAKWDLLGGLGVLSKLEVMVWASISRRTMTPNGWTWSYEGGWLDIDKSIWALS